MLDQKQSTNIETSFLKSKKIKVKGCDYLIRERKKITLNKPPLFIWNLTECCYGSSLFKTKKPNILFFDIEDKSKGEKIGYHLEINTMTVKEISINGQKIK